MHYLSFRSPICKLCPASLCFLYSVSVSIYSSLGTLRITLLLLRLLQPSTMQTRTNQNTNSVGYPTVNSPVSPTVAYLVPQACCQIEALVFQQEYSASGISGYKAAARLKRSLWEPSASVRGYSENCQSSGAAHRHAWSWIHPTAWKGNSSSTAIKSFGTGRYRNFYRDRLLGYLVVSETV